MKRWLWMLAGVALSALASSGNGSWSGSSVGGRVSVGHQTLVSRPISPAAPLPAAATISTLTWRITLLNRPPPGLLIKLCARSACFPLQGLSGTLQLSTPHSANNVFHFIYSVNSRGPLMPALQVVSNQLSVNYH